MRDGIREIANNAEAWRMERERLIDLIWPLVKTDGTPPRERAANVLDALEADRVGQ